MKAKIDMKTQKPLCFSGLQSSIFVICVTDYIVKDNWQLLLQIRSVKPSFLPRDLKFLSALESSNYLKLVMPTILFW